MGVATTHCCHLAPATPLFSPLLAPQNVSNSQKRTRTRRSAERISSSGATGNVQNPLGERHQSAVKALRARETGTQAGTPTMNEASKVVERSRGELGPVAATNIAQDYAMCAYLHALHTCTCIHLPLCVCVCVHVVVPSRKTLTSGACQRSQGLCSHY